MSHRIYICKGCETRPTVFRPYPRRLESLTVLQVSSQRQHSLLSYLKTLSVVPAGTWTSRQTGAYPTQLAGWCHVCCHIPIYLGPLAVVFLFWGNSIICTPLTNFLSYVLTGFEGVQTSSVRFMDWWPFSVLNESQKYILIIRNGLWNTTGSPSSKYKHWRTSALLRNIRNIKNLCGKKPIISVTYENERNSLKNSLPYIKCVLSLSCVVHGPIYGRFVGCTVNGFLSI